MLSYNIEEQIEGDIDKHSNYQLINYEFPFPENSVLIERDKEAKRIQQSFVTSIKQSLINNNN
jgi:hypothetical protein